LRSAERGTGSTTHTHRERERERERERGSTRRARWPTVENERVKGLGFRV